LQHSASIESRQLSIDEERRGINQTCDIDFPPAALLLLHPALLLCFRHDAKQAALPATNRSGDALIGE
jgi:hypothetical protein